MKQALRPRQIAQPVWRLFSPVNDGIHHRRPVVEGSQRRIALDK